MKIKLIFILLIAFIFITGCSNNEASNNTNESEARENMPENITENTTTEITAAATTPQVTTVEETTEPFKLQRTISPSDKNYFFGISPTDSYWISDEEWENYKLIGIKSLRIHLQASHSWEEYDEVLKRAAENDIEVVMLVSYETYASESEADDLGWGPIMHFTNSLDLVDVLAKAIPYFKDKGVTAWEIWNEENGMWNLRPDEYAQLITQVYERCKYTDKWDENAVIVFGGLDAVNVGFSKGVNYGSQQWLINFYKTEAYKAFKEKYNRSPFDVMAIHPYNTIDVDGNLEVSMNDLKTAIEGVVLKTMAKNGDENMPVWITELGDQNGDNEKNAEILKLYMKTAYEIPQVTRFLWFKYFYAGSNYSIVEQDGTTPRPSLYAYAEVVKELTGK